MTRSAGTPKVSQKIAAELEAEVAKWEKLEKTGTEAEKAEAKARLAVIGRGHYGQLAGLLERMEIGISNGRMYSFPGTPWDYDGISSFPMWLEDESPNAALRGVVGSSAVRVWNKGLKGEDQVKYMIHDYGARGPWQDYMDAKIKVIPDRWVKYPPPFKQQP